MAYCLKVFLHSTTISANAVMNHFFDEMEAHLVSRAHQLNNQIKHNTSHCELKTLKWLLEDSTAELINDSCAQKAEQDYVKLESITLNSTNYTVSIHGKTQVHVICNPSNATDKKFHYISSDPGIFTITTQGTIIGNKAGEAILTVKSSVDESVTTTAKVTVTGTVEKTLSLGALTNVDSSVDDAKDGTIIIKRGNMYVADNYTDIVVLDVSKAAIDLWNTVINTYPSQYLVTVPELTNNYPSEVIVTGDQIRIIFVIDVHQYTINLIKIDGVVYKTEYYIEFML